MIINRDDYTERNIEFSIMRINLLSLAIAVPLVMISNWMYKLADVDTKLKSSFFLMVLLGTIVHELIHAVVAVRYAQSGWKSIKFGILWKYLAPYCHCNEALTVSQYRKFAMMPTLVAIICFIASLFIGNWTFTLCCVVIVAGGAGDIFIMIKLRKENAETLVLDYSDKIGAAILEKKDESK